MTGGLVSIVGPPGSGKTTLAHAAAADLPAKLICEDYAGNPFLSDAYEGRADLGLPSQLYFLLSRLGQLAAGNLPPDRWAVSDYGFCQDAIYARRVLSQGDLKVYERLHAPAAALVRPPDVLVVLEASTEVLLARIAARGRRYERTFSRGFLEDMQAAYRGEDLGPAGRVIRLDAARADFRRDEDRREVVQNIRRELVGLQGARR